MWNINMTTNTNNKRVKKKGDKGNEKHMGWGRQEEYDRQGALMWNKWKAWHWLGRREKLEGRDRVYTPFQISGLHFPFPFLKFQLTTSHWLPTFSLCLFLFFVCPNYPSLAQQFHAYLNYIYKKKKRGLFIKKKW